MWRSRLAIVCLAMISANVSFGQLKKQFFVEDSDEFDKVNVSLKVNFGACNLKATKNPGVFNLYSRKDSEHFGHSFTKNISDGVCDLNLELEEMHSESLGKSISTSIFGDRPIDHDNFWKIFLSESKTYSLNIEYGVGRADIDLSGLAVENLRIHTGSADVNVGYLTEGINQVEMDTFFVKVDLGNVTVRNLGKARSDVVIADVGFGNLLLDLDEIPEKSSTIKGNVGAGTVLITIPKADIPVKLVINESWLCRVNLPPGFSKTGTNSYVNKSWTEGAEKSLTFNMDVSMGSVIFRTK